MSTPSSPLGGTAVDPGVDPLKWAAYGRVIKSWIESDRWYLEVMTGVFSRVQTLCCPKDTIIMSYDAPTHLDISLLSTWHWNWEMGECIYLHLRVLRNFFLTSSKEIKCSAWTKFYKHLGTWLCPFPKKKKRKRDCFPSSLRGTAHRPHLAHTVYWQSFYSVSSLLY